MFYVGLDHGSYQSPCRGSMSFGLTRNLDRSLYGPLQEPLVGFHVTFRAWLAQSEWLMLRTLLVAYWVES